jgi:hypothetical protein
MPTIPVPPVELPESIQVPPPEFPDTPELPVDVSDALDKLSSEEGQGVFEAISDWTSQVQIPDLSDLSKLLNDLTAMPIWQGIALVLFGMLYLTTGIKWFKMLVALNAGVLGGLAGGVLAIRMGAADQWMVGMLIGGIGLAVLAWPLVKTFVCIFGGLVGGVFGRIVFAQIATQANHPEWMSYSWIGVVAGALLLAVCAIHVFKFGVMMITSLQGAIMLCAGLLCILLPVESFGPALRNHIEIHPHYAFFALLGVTLVGLSIQLMHWTGIRKRAAQAKSEEPAKKEET